MNDDELSEPWNDDLDRVIRAALVVDTDHSGVERLEQFWRAQSWKDRWRQRAYFGMSAAAAAAMLIGFLIVAKNRNNGDVTTAKVTSERVPPPVEVEPAAEPLADELEVDAPVGLAGRTPTEYERFMFIARTGRPTPTTTESRIDEAISRRGATSQDILAEVEEVDGVNGLIRTAQRAIDPKLRQTAMARLLEIGSDESLIGFLERVRDRSTRVDALASADAAVQLPRESLLAYLDHNEKSVRLAAATVLGHVNGPDVTQALINRVTKQPAGATEAWLALMSCRGETAAEFIAYASRRPQLLGHLNGARVQWAYMTP
jgi:hypothetical protein